MRSLLFCLVWAVLMLAPCSQAHAVVECEVSRTCSVDARGVSSPPLLDWAAKIEYIELMGEPRFAGSALTLQEYRMFAGIGAVVCRLDGARRTATAFLVGRFDLAVTVGHVFEIDGRWLSPEDCFYTNAGPAGRIRERIPIASIKPQWQLEPATYGQPASDLAVVRLAVPVRLAMRTMSLTRFTETHAPVMLIGYRSDLGADALKRKLRGRVYLRPGRECVRFTHDVDARNVAPGAPLIDIRDNVVIGIHTRMSTMIERAAACAMRGNAMILMNSWLERTLRAEIASTQRIEPN